MLRKTVRAQGWQSVGWLNVNIRTLRGVSHTPVVCIHALWQAQGDHRSLKLSMSRIAILNGDIEKLQVQHESSIHISIPSTTHPPHPPTHSIPFHSIHPSIHPSIQPVLASSLHPTDRPKRLLKMPKRPSSPTRFHTGCDRRDQWCRRQRDSDQGAEEGANRVGALCRRSRPTGCRPSSRVL